MYTFYSMQAKDAISAYHPYLRSIVAPFIPELQNLKKFKGRGAELMKPILQQQLAKEDNEKILRDDNDDEQGNMIGWMLRHTPGNQRSDLMVLANNQMGYKFSHNPGLGSKLNIGFSINGSNSYDHDGHNSCYLRLSNLP